MLPHSWLDVLQSVVSRPPTRGHRRRPAGRLRVERLEDRSLPSGGAVLRWNALALDAVRDDHALTGPHLNAGPARSARALAIVHAAMYDAANSITHAYQ